MLRRTAFLSLVGILVTTAAFAQVLPRRQEGGRQPRAEATPAQPGAANQNLDSTLATKLLLGNQEEVAISKMAMERATNDSVKKFANQMIQAHTEGIQNLQKFAAKDGSWKLQEVDVTSTSRTTETRTDGKRETTAPDNPGRADNPRNDNPRTDNARKDNADQPETATNQRRENADNRRDNADNQRNRTQEATATTTTTTEISGRNPQHSQMAAIDREACQRCLALTISELQQHQGADFDKAYVGQQISNHIGMIAKLETFQQHASPELREVISKSLTMAQDHLQQAKDLCNELKAEKSASTATSPAKERKE